MLKIRRILVIAKTQFINYIKYPENSLGFLIYIGAILLVGLLVQFYGGENAKNIYGASPIVYYATGLFLYTLIGNQNSAAFTFSIWRLDILSKPLSPEIFLLGNYLGSLLCNIVPSIFLLVLSLVISAPSLSLINFVSLLILLIVAFIASIGMSYFMAGIGLIITPHGYFFTGLTFLFTVFTGIIVPLDTIPIPLRCISYIIPYTWAIDCFRGILLKTRTFLPIDLEFLILLLSGSITLLLGRLYLLNMLKSIRSRKVIVR